MVELDDRTRAILAEEEAWRAARPAPGAYGIGDVALLDVGCTVWSTERGYAGVGPGGEQIEPIGGVVLDVVDQIDDDGTIHRAFRVIDPYRTRPQLTYHVLLEDEIDRDSVEGPETSRMCMLISRLAEELAHRAKKGPLVGNLAADINRLCGLL